MAVTTSLASFGWGQKGHDTVAYIAECNLTAAKAAAEELLDGKSIVYYANWLDNASHTPEYAYSKTWHYKNIDADKTFQDAPLNEKGDIVRALDEQIKILGDKKNRKRSGTRPENGGALPRRYSPATPPGPLIRFRRQPMGSPLLQKPDKSPFIMGQQTCGVSP